MNIFGLSALLFLFSIQAFAINCGMQGPVKERILDCSRVAESQVDQWQLISQFSTIYYPQIDYSVYLDTLTQHVWFVDRSNYYSNAKLHMLKIEELIGSKFRDTTHKEDEYMKIYTSPTKNSIAGWYDPSELSSYSGSINERSGKKRVLNFKFIKGKAEFIVTENGSEQVIKSLSLRNLPSIPSEKNIYNFNILRTSPNVASAMYEATQGSDGGASLGMMALTTPFVVAYFGIVIAALPVDAALTFFSQKISKEGRTLYKFSQLMKGENHKAGTRVFDELILRILKL